MQNTTSDTFRVAIYCRVSTEEQREGQTIDSQVSELERFASNKQWMVAGVYKDEGWSGSVLARPELDRLRDCASRGLFGAVLINDVDRLARDVTHLGIIKRELERRDVALFFRKLPNEKNPANNLLVNILGSFAEFERELIADRTRRGKRYKVEVRKQYLGALAPYGFRRCPSDASNASPCGLEVFPEEALVVRQMYDWVDREALSARQVVVRLNARGLFPRKGRVWQRSSVLRILRSQVYTGIWHFNKHQRCEPTRSTIRGYRRSLRSSSRVRPKTEWLAVPLPERLSLIRPEQWEKVQKQLDRNVAFSPRNSKHTYFLAGLVRCGSCDASYTGDPSHGRFAYRCIRRCGRIPSIKEEFLNATVWTAVEEALKNPNVIIEGLKAIQGDLPTASGEGKDELSRGLEQIRLEEARILEAYRLSILTPEQLALQLQALKQRRRLLESATGTAGRHDAIPKGVLNGSIRRVCAVVGKQLDQLDASGQRTVLRTLLTKVIFHGDRVRLIGCLPMDNDGSGADPNHRRIATTTSGGGGHNLAFKSVFFSLERPVRQPTKPPALRTSP